MRIWRNIEEVVQAQKGIEHVHNNREAIGQNLIPMYIPTFALAADSPPMEESSLFQKDNFKDLKNYLVYFLPRLSY
jgi:hypothetical protein